MTLSSYKLESVSLKANEASNFVIEINQDYFEANEESGKCTIIGEFATTGTATFTITVKNVSGATIDNSSLDNGQFNCEISAAGRYYIEIKTDTDCTGSLSIEFKTGKISF